MEQLNVDEIMALQAFGMRDAEIRKLHLDDFDRMLEQILSSDGLMLSEQPFGVKANPHRLVARNRLQAALSNAVILAQCPAQSGSLHTMRFAREYRKKSYAVKFPKWTVANAGNRMLLEEGLAETLQIQDIK